jgi:hypothetical protein
MQISVRTPSFGAYAERLRLEMAKGFSITMRSLTRDFELAMEAATRASGLGARIAKTWQSRTYPDASRDSLNPAGYVWSKAPGPMRAFTLGATIRGKSGNYLAIPSPEVAALPAMRRRGGREAGFTPARFEQVTGIKLRLIKGDGGIGFLIGDRDASRVGRRGRAGFKSVSARAAKRGAKAKPFLAFTLVPSVTIRQRINVQQIGAQWQRQAVSELARAATAAITRAQLEVQTGGEFGRTRLGRTR